MSGYVIIAMATQSKVSIYTIVINNTIYYFYPHENL